MTIINKKPVSNALRIIRRWVIMAGIVLSGFVIVIFMMQRHLIYFPTVFNAYDAQILADNNIKVVCNGDLEWLAMPFTGRADLNKNTVVVFFHGNAGAAIDRVFKAKLFNAQGYDVALPEYPAYGTNGHLKPSEGAFYTAGRDVLNRTMHDFPNHDIILYGESIGSGTAVQMATEFPVTHLVIEAGFTSLVHIAQKYYPFLPVNYLLRDRFDNIDKIADIDANIIIMHGRHDEIIPFEHGQSLADVAGDKAVFIALDGAGHNDVYDYLSFSTLLKHLD